MMYKLKLFLTSLILVGLVAPLGAACSSDDDDATARPTAYQTPTGPCMPWVATPHEADDSGYRACDFPIPRDPPVREAGMTDAEFFLLGGLFGWGMGHHNFIYSQPYYDNYIHPAYTRYPGYVAYGYGHQPVPTYSNVNIYKTTVVNYANTKHAAEERTAEKDPKLSGYKTANGKAYTGTSVPKKAFSGSNVPRKPLKPAGDAPFETAKPRPAPAPKTVTPPKPPKPVHKSYSRSKKGK